MRKVLILLAIAFFGFSVFADDFYPDPDIEDSYIDTGANGLGYDLVTKIRKDVLEGVILNSIEDGVGEISIGEIELPEFNYNGMNLSLKINNIKVRIALDYMFFDRDGKDNSFKIGFRISDITQIDVANSFLMIVQGAYSNDQKREIIRQYFLNYFNHFGTIDVEAGINRVHLNAGVYRLDSIELQNMTINGWSFDDESVLISNGLNTEEEPDEDIYLFAKIGKMIAGNIFTQIENNENLSELFELEFSPINCTALDSSICQRSVLEENSCIVDEIFNTDSAFCTNYLNGCQLLPGACVSYFARYTFKILQPRSSLTDNKKDAYYSIAGNVNIMRGKQPVWMKIKNSSGEILKEGYFLQDENLSYTERISSPDNISKEKLVPMEGSNLLETTISEKMLGIMMFHQIKLIFTEREEIKDYNIVISEGPYFNIVDHSWNDIETGKQVNKNVARLKIKMSGEKYGAVFDATLIIYIDAFIQETEKDGTVLRKLNFKIVDREVTDMDVEFEWFWDLLSFFAGDILTSIVIPSDFLLSGLISSTIIQSVVSDLFIKLGGDKLEGNIDGINNLDGVDLSFLSSEIMDNAFGEGHEYKYNAYFRRIINGDKKNSGLVFEIGFSDDIEPLLTNKKNYISSYYRDNDSDGIINIMDNCRDVYNPYQSDEDGDGIGNMCDGGPRNGVILIPVKDRNAPFNSPIHDTDSDGIANMTDNCPGIVNAFVEAPKNSELISGMCSGGSTTDVYGVSSCNNPIEGGAVYNILTNKFLFTETGKCFDGGIHFWQPDADLDGIGDICDHKDGIKIMGETVSDSEAGYYSLDMSTGLRDVQDGKKDCTGYQSSTCRIPVIKNKYADITVRMNTKGDSNLSQLNLGATETLTQKYCWVDKIRMGSWGNDGFCTTTEGKGLRVITPEMKYLPVYGYSHGSDPEPADASGNPNWKDPHWKDDGIKTQKCKTSDPYFVIPGYENSGECVFTWDWRENLKEYPLLYLGYVVPVDEDKENGSKDSFITYVFSSGVQAGEDQKYMVETVAGEQINPLHFKNNRIYARSKRDTFGGTDISYYRGVLIEQHPFYFGWFDIDSYLQRFGISPWWWMTGPGMPFEHDWIDVYRSINGRIMLVEKDMSAAKIAGIADSVFVGRDNITGIFSFNANSNQKVLMTTRDSDTAWSVGAIIEMPHYAGTVHKMAELIPGQDFLLMDSSSVYRFNTMSGFGDVNQPSFRVCSVNIQVGEIGRLPFDGAMAEIIKLGNRVLIINKNAGELELYELDMVQGMVVPLEYENGPSGRAHFNFEVINGTLYVAGGAEISGTQILPLSDVYKFSFENGWTTVAEDTGLNLMGAVIAPDNGLLKVYSRPFTKTDRIHVALIDENTGEINLGTEIIEGGGIIRQDYCIDDNGIDLFPGIEENGICRKVEKNDYEYSSYTFLDYKMSLAGSGNNLYIGGLTGVRRMDIGNDGSLKMKELVLAGHITSIAVSDDRLFGASIDSIKVFKLGSDGSVKFDRSVKASGCKDLRIRGDLLFAGMEGKVSVYDISNGKMNLIKNISVENNVEDLEIAGNNLFVYHEKGFWFWKKNALTKFDISDLNNTVRIGNRNIECDDAEMMKDESHVYLGCANGQFRIDRNVSGLSVETVKGKKNYFRDSYVNDGIIYTVHSGRLFMSR